MTYRQSETYSFYISYVLSYYIYIYILSADMHVSGFTPHQCSFVHTQLHDDSYITTCECSHQMHVGQHGDINASRHAQSLIGSSAQTTTREYMFRSVYIFTILCCTLRQIKLILDKFTIYLNVWKVCMNNLVQICSHEQFEPIWFTA